MYGGTQPLPFLDYGGYDATADLLAPTRISLDSLDVLGRLLAPNQDEAGAPFLPPGTAALCPSRP